MDRIISLVQQYLSQYTLRQKIVVTTLAIGLVSSILALVLWANRPEYELLYNRINPESANSIVQELRSNNIKYVLENGGTTIYVPRQHVSEMRLKFSQSDFLKDGISGYELFEKNQMGMTTFMQRLNLRRALEGELTRTINQFPEVAQSRVHLVIPEKRLFEKDQRGSASVVLHVQPGVSLGEKQINGITALVANSAEGIEAEDVVVLDANGKILIDRSKDDSMVGSANNQWALQNDIEKALQHKVTEIVEGVVGYQNSVVQVSAELNFDQLERTTEEIDPDKIAVLSEETFSQSDEGGENAGGGKTEKTTSNFEMSKKLERFVSKTGSIQRLTVAVLVNGSYTTVESPEGESTREYQPRSEAELQQIASLVKSSVGYSETRGDVVDIQNMPFDNQAFEADQKFFEQAIENEKWERYGMYGIVTAALLLGFFLVRSMLKNSIDQLSPLALAEQGQVAQANIPIPTAEQTPAVPTESGERGSANAPISQGTSPPAIPPAEKNVSEDLYMKKLTPEARAKIKASDKMMEEVLGFVKDAPEDASRILRTWLTEEGAAS